MAIEKMFSPEPFDNGPKFFLCFLQGNNGQFPLRDVPVTGSAPQTYTIGIENRLAGVGNPSLFSGSGNNPKFHFDGAGRIHRIVKMVCKQFSVIRMDHFCKKCGILYQHIGWIFRDPLTRWGDIV